MNHDVASPLLRAVENLIDDAGGLLVLGAVAGLVAAGLTALARLQQRIRRLEHDVARLRRDRAGAAAAPGNTASAREPVGPEAPTPPRSAPAADAPAPRRGIEKAAAAPVQASRPAMPAETPPPVPSSPFAPSSPSSPSGATRAPTRAPFVDPPSDDAGSGLLARLFGSGNWLVRGGVLLLFLGVGFLLKFAADNQLLPVPLRLAGVAAGALALLVLGFRLIGQRRAYAVALEGGGVGLLYLTLFASFRLYGLLPAEAALVLMTAVTAAAGWLAWRQDALALAVLGALGGFAAPILASTGSGSHVLLFSYYAVLNLGVLGLAFVRSWRVLNLVGFAATFVLSGLWGQRFYDPGHFATVEPFLVLFFLMYLAVAVLFALRRTVALRDPLDATLVFGTPLVAFGLQSRLLADSETGLALSALAAAGVYGGLALLLHRRTDDGLRALVQAFAALAVGFATLAVPLLLDARWTSASWALEGAALLWVGWRQRRALARLCGAGLQIVAGASWVWHVSARPAWETGDWLGTVMVAVAGLASSAVLAHAAAGERDGDEAPLGLTLGLWGLLWWYGGGLVHIGQVLEGQREAWVPGVVLLFLAASAVVLELAGARRRWPLARAAAASLPVLLIGHAALQVFEDPHPLESVAAAGWPAALAAAALVLWRQDTAGGRIVAAGHAAGAWLLAGLAGWELAWRFGEWLPAIESWRRLAFVLAPAVIAAVIAAGAGRARAWPFTTRGRLLLTAGAGPLVCAVAGGVIALSVDDPGAPWPIPYLPLLNPLDVGLAAAAAAVLLWARRAREVLAADLRNALSVAGAVVGFVWLNGALLRTLHFWADIPYRFGPMFRSTLAQASLSLLWATTALLVMVGASRAASRTLWGVGAALMVTVVAKLMLVDLASSATIARIVSFISVGVLLMIVGYLAPVPPRRGAPRTDRAAAPPA